MYLNKLNSLLKIVFLSAWFICISQTAVLTSWKLLHPVPISSPYLLFSSPPRGECAQIWPRAIPPCLIKLSLISGNNRPLASAGELLKSALKDWWLTSQDEWCGKVRGRDIYRLKGPSSWERKLKTEEGKPAEEIWKSWAEQ